MTSDNVENAVRTGIAGLDAILMGGIPKANVILVEGTTGSGKTLFGLEFIVPGDHAIQRTRHHRGVRSQSR
jgi:circadian clock protein KaiC